MRKLTVNLKDHSYDIVIENGLLDHLGSYIKEVYKNKEIFIITDTNVEKYYLEKVKKALNEDFIVKSVVMPAGEATKSFAGYQELCQKLIDLEVRRNHLLLALGGGVIGDLTGFVAATMYRGIDYIGIPTSLLAQMDSSIGGKTGIDFYNRKNIIGAFKQPLMVLIDPKTLDTLPYEEFRNGMGELIKHGAIGNEKLLKLVSTGIKTITEEIIEESLKVKKRVVEIDEFDKCERMFLNFGHTFGHAIELKYGYRHGEAVAIGMLMALKFGIDLNVTNRRCYEIIESILKSYDFPLDDYNYKDYLKDMAYDKKNLAGEIRFIFIEDIGKPIIYKIKEDSIGDLM
ncbi:MAG: 3-dehydroquinate synthase [Anaeroplasmataceae bacterium]